MKNGCNYTPSHLLFSVNQPSLIMPPCLSLNTIAPKQKKPFRFFNYLLQNEAFLDIVASHWFSFSIRGSAMFRLARKLKTLKKVIREFSKQNYSDIWHREESYGGFWGFIISSNPHSKWSIYCKCSIWDGSSGEMTNIIQCGGIFLPPAFESHLDISWR